MSHHIPEPEGIFVNCVKLSYVAIDCRYLSDAIKNWLRKNRQHLMHLPIELTALSWSKTTFSCNIYQDSKCSSKDTAESKPQSWQRDGTTCQQEPCLQLTAPSQWASPVLGTAVKKHHRFKAPWIKLGSPQRLLVLQILQWTEDLKTPSCTWFKDPTWRCSKESSNTFPTGLQPEQKSNAAQGTTAWLHALCPSPLHTA